MKKKCWKEYGGTGSRYCQRTPVLQFSYGRVSLDSCIYHGISLLWLIKQGRLGPMKVAKL